MKRIAILFFVLLFSIVTTKAQDVFDPKEPVTWLGLDFSALKFIKTDEAITNQELQDKYFPGWNELILNEPKKYDIAKAIDRDIDEYIDAVTKVNQTAKADFITKDAKAFEHLNNTAIRQMVKQYDLKGKSGIGLVFIVESMDKIRKEASIWVTFINMSTKEVLLSKPVTGESGGFGFRNYWAASINKVLKNLPANMRRWEKG